MPNATKNNATKNSVAIAALLAIACSMSSAAAQEPSSLTPQFAERRGRTSPIMVPNSQRPTADVKQLVFSGRGDDVKLFAAGMDKVVRCWSVTEQAGDQLSMQYEGEITWPIYRDLRGVILALDAKSVQGRHRLAFGGVGATTSQVNLKYATGNEPAEALVADTRRQVVDAVALSPDGNLLAVAHEAEPGQAAKFYVWDLTVAPRKKSTITTGISNIRALSFSPDGASLAVAGQEFQAGGKGRPGLVQIWQIRRSAGSVEIRNAGRDHPLQGTVDSAIVGIDWLNDQQWVAGTVCGVTNAAASRDVHHVFAARASQPGGERVEVVNQTNRPLTIQTEQNGRWTTGRRIAPGATLSIDPVKFRAVNHRGESQAGSEIFLPAGWRYEFTPYVTAIERVGDAAPARFVVAMWNHLADPAHKNWIEIQDGSFRSVVKLEEPRFSGLISAVAASPDGSLVAAAGLVELERFGGTEVAQLRIWSAKTGELLARIPDDLQSDQLDLLAAVSPIATLEISAQDGRPHAIHYATGHAIGRQEPLAMTRQFVLGESRRRIHRLEQPRPLAAEKDWRIESAGDGRTFVVRGKGRNADTYFGPLPVDFNKAYCGVPFGKDNKTFVAVGYDNGIKIWAQEGRRRVYRICRSYYGHTGPVTCMSVSPDRNWLATGSTDGTISAWSLDGLDNGNELGVRWTRSGQSELQVASVVRGSIGHEAGFQQGMVIAELLEGGVAVPRNQIASKLAAPTPGRELFFKVRLRGESFSVQTPLSHDPVWTLYTFADNKCIVALPQGFFDAQVSSANDLVLSRVQWHVNRGGGWGGREKEQGVIRFPADMYKNQFLNHDLVAKAIASGKPITVSEDAEQFPIQPTINFVGKTGDGRSFSRERGLPATISDEQLPLAVRPRVAGASDSELWINGKRLTARDQNPAGEFLIKKEYLRAGRNYLVGVAVIRHAGKTFSNREDLPFVYRPDESRPAQRLFYLGVGVTELQHADVFADLLVPLKHADNDALRLGAALEDAIGRRSKSDLQLGRLATLTAREATKQNILDQLEGLAAEVRPDDVAVILLAGHGTHVDPFSEQAGAADSSSGFFYIAYDTGRDFQQTAVTGAELDEKLSRLPCKCVLMLDTCHSEAAGSQRQLLDRAGLQFGPLVLSACETAQESRDFDGIAREGSGHGAFTAAVLEALTGSVTLKARNQGRTINADNNGDGRLSLLELCQYCRDRTPQLVGELPGGAGLEQNPVVMTSLTFDPDEVILCRVPTDVASNR